MDKEKLIEFFEKIKNNEELKLYNERQTKQYAITPILNILEWDRDNPEEVSFEHPIDKGYVDYALMYDNQSKIIIEAKKASADLENDDKTKQVLTYCFGKTVGLAVLTNGLKWWFYLPSLTDKPWEQRKFFAFDIKNEKNFEIVAEKVISILSKNCVVSGKNIENAKNIYEKQEKNKIIEDTIPQVWDEMLEKPDETLIELIANRVEEKCEYKPESQIIKEFFKKSKANQCKNREPNQNVNFQYKSMQVHEKRYIEPSSSLIKTNNLKLYQKLALEIYNHGKNNECSLNTIYKAVENPESAIRNTLQIHCIPNMDVKKSGTAFPFLFDFVSRGVWKLSDEGINYVEENLL